VHERVSLSLPGFAEYMCVLQAIQRATTRPRELCTKRAAAAKAGRSSSRWGRTPLRPSQGTAAAAGDVVVGSRAASMAEGEDVEANELEEGDERRLAHAGRRRAMDRDRPASSAPGSACVAAVALESKGEQDALCSLYIGGDAEEPSSRKPPSRVDGRRDLGPLAADLHEGAHEGQAVDGALVGVVEARVLSDLRERRG